MAYNPFAFDAVVDDLFRDDFSILEVSQKSPTKGEAVLKVDTPFMDGKRLVVKWDSGSGWMHPQGARTIYYDVYMDDVPKSSRIYTELVNSYERHWFSQDPNGADDSIRECIAEDNVIRKISKYIRSHGQDEPTKQETYMENKAWKYNNTLSKIRESESGEMTKEEAFRNWGTMNGWSSETYDEFSKAEEIHDKDMEAHPEDHHPMPQRNNWRCWHEVNCSCGFRYSWDSSD